MKKNLKRRTTVVGLAAALLFSFNTKATVVQLQTVFGNVDINLFDEATPQTVENFLNYVNSGAYLNNVVHRSVPDFVIQAGGFQFNDDFPPDAIPTDPPVPNEPVLSNVRGTIAMAKLGGDPDSATSQWFISLEDNSATLDTQNGGFTAFGLVLGDGMDIIDDIAALPLLNAGGALNTLPVRDFDQADVDAGRLPGADNLAIITDVVVIDSAVVTNPDIVPVPNTLIGAQDGGPATPDNNTGGGGGSFGLWAFMLTGLAFARRKLAR